MGLLKEGDKLPTIREVVTMVAINPNTVVKAYRELENQSFIEKRYGIGTFVSKQPAALSPDINFALLSKLDDWLSETEAAGLDEEATEVLFNLALRKRKGSQYGAGNTN